MFSLGGLLFVSFCQASQRFFAREANACLSVIQQFHASAFKRRYQFGEGALSWASCTSLKLHNRQRVYICDGCQLFLIPPQKAASGPAMLRRQYDTFFLHFLDLRYFLAID